MPTFVREFGARVSVEDESAQKVIDDLLWGIVSILEREFVQEKDIFNVYKLTDIEAKFCPPKKPEVRTYLSVHIQFINGEHETWSKLHVERAKLELYAPIKKILERSRRKS